MNGNRHRLAGSSGTSGCSPSTTAGLGFTGFLFPLFKLVLGVGSEPAIRQQGFQRGSVPLGDGRNSAQHVGQVGPYVHAVPPSTLHQRVERRCRLSAVLEEAREPGSRLCRVPGVLQLRLANARCEQRPAPVAGGDGRGRDRRTLGFRAALRRGDGDRGKPGCGIASGIDRTPRRSFERGVRFNLLP